MISLRSVPSIYNARISTREFVCFDDIEAIGSLNNVDIGEGWYPAFDVMRPDPRFATLVRKMGLQPLPLPISQ